LRVAVVFIPEHNRDRILNISRALAKGIESQGHTVDLIDGSRDINTKLTIYKYIAVGTENKTFFSSKIPDKVPHFLASSGKVAGKRCFAYIPRTLLFSARALQNLMKSMEKEGMILKFSEIISSDLEAEAIGKRLSIK
jgi:hypothetical protein